MYSVFGMVQFAKFQGNTFSGAQKARPFEISCSKELARAEAEKFWNIVGAQIPKLEKAKA